jgi:predicted Rossmann fold flavoprotein
MTMEWDCVVVGAGAAGLIAAERAAARGLRTLLLEKNRKPGVKILMSGGTRCNLTHDTDARGIVEAFGPRGRFLRAALARLGPRELVQLFHDEGVPTKIERTGKVFPCSDTAVDVQQALLRRLHRASAVMATGEPLRDVEAYGEGFQLRTPTRILNTRLLVVTTGGLSYPGCGTTGDGYAWARQFGHAIVPTVPALAPLRSSSPWIAGLQGVTLDEVQLRLRIDRTASASVAMNGPAGMVFTHFGISGPAPMNLSRDVSYAPPDARLIAECDLFPHTKLEVLVERLKEACRAAGKKHLANILGGLTPQRVADTILALGGFDPNRRGAEVPRSDLQRLGQLLKCLPIEITGTLGYPKAEVTAGGIVLDEVDPNTLQSRLRPGLYFAGEILDLDGPIGGYNFQAAFSTGWVAGSQLTANRLLPDLGSGQ